MALVPAIGAVVHGANPAVAATHMAGLLAAIWLARARGRLAQVAGDWLPLVALPFLYAELPYLIGGAGSPFRDAVVQRWESDLFGASPAQTLAGALPSRWLSEVLHGGYISYYLIIYVPPLLLYLRGRRAFTTRSMFSPEAWLGWRSPGRRWLS